MKIAVFRPDDIHLSMNIILNEVCQRLVNSGVKFDFFSNINKLPQKADIYWDPRLGGGGISELNKNITNKPIVLTIHGTALFSIKLKDNRRKYSETFKLIKNRLIMKRTWRYFANQCDKVITVSDYAKHEIAKHLYIPEIKIKTIYLAADTNLFYPPDKETIDKNNQKPYFFHVSVLQPKKNIRRIIKAYLSIADRDEIPEFLIVAPNITDEVHHPKLKIINQRISSQQCAEYMRQAYALVNPSLHETFCLPIVEAMACGLPVITSNTTACPEIAGDAALLVNPHSIDSIAKAMLRIFNDDNLRSDLKERGLKRAAGFSWEKCATEHLSIFKNTAIL